MNKQITITLNLQTIDTKILGTKRDYNQIDRMEETKKTKA